MDPSKYIYLILHTLNTFLQNSSPINLGIGRRSEDWSIFFSLKKNWHRHILVIEENQGASHLADIVQVILKSLYLSMKFSLFQHQEPGQGEIAETQIPEIVRKKVAWL